MADKNSINLGRVLPIYKGDWSADTNYDILDIVYYNGNSYTAKQPSTNQEPKADSAYWGLSSVKGQKGDKGDKGVKGDKGDTGPAGKDGYMPVIGGRNLIVRTGELVGQSIGLDGKISPYDPSIVTPAIIKVTPGEPLTMSGIATGIGKKFRYAFYDEAGDTLIRALTEVMPVKTVIAPAEAATFRISYPKESQVKLERGNVATDWSPAPEDIDSAIAKAPKLNGNNMYVGDNTYMGTNTFMDGLSLNGKNKVNDITDTDWLDIPLAEGRTGTAKYKVSLGKVFVHIDNVKGITATGYSDQSQIGTLPINPNPYTLRYIIQSYNSTMVLKQITILSNGRIYVTNPMGNPMSENDSYMLDTVLI